MASSRKWFWRRSPEISPTGAPVVSLGGFPTCPQQVPGKPPPFFPKGWRIFGSLQFSWASDCTALRRAASDLQPPSPWPTPSRRSKSDGLDPAGSPLVRLTMCSVGRLRRCQGRRALSPRDRAPRRRGTTGFGTGRPPLTSSLRREACVRSCSARRNRRIGANRRIWACLDRDAIRSSGGHMRPEANLLRAGGLSATLADWKRNGGSRSPQSFARCPPGHIG